MTITPEQLYMRFTFHPSDTSRKQDRHELVRKACHIAAKAIVSATVEGSREQSLAITKLEEAMFWANAAIAREASHDFGVS